MSTVAPTALDLEALRSAIRGRLITPDEPEYDDARMVILGTLDPHPAVLVRVADAADVAHVVNLVRETGVPFAVRSGGHSGAGHSTIDGGLVLDVRDLKELEIDVAGRTAWAGSGLTAAEFTSAAAERGLAVGFGDTGSVGLAGLTLGGGVGYLGRKYGLTIDSLLAAELVTADGQVRTVDADHDPDLFWAIRGGGGNFGVATRFRYRLHDLGSVVGGMLILPATAETIAGFIEAADGAPDELSTIANVMPAPPMPFLPDEVHGKLVILAVLCHAGDEASGQRAVAPFRALATPLADEVKPMSYPEIYPPDDPEYRPKAAALTMFIDRFDLDVGRTIMSHLEASDAAMRVAQLRVLGGAIARVPADATAYAHRSRAIMINLASFFEDDDRSVRERWVADFADALDQGDDAAYVNFLADEGADRVRDAYPGPTWNRLRELKARYDPANLFRRNQNIPPA
jgi:FAD/FMN-containing dehydrogenase